jgi:hypothetical protein
MAATFVLTLRIPLRINLFLKSWVVFQEVYNRISATKHHAVEFQLNKTRDSELMATDGIAFSGGEGGRGNYWLIQRSSTSCLERWAKSLNVFEWCCKAAPMVGSRPRPWHRLGRQCRHMPSALQRHWKSTALEGHGHFSDKHQPEDQLELADSREDP